MVGAIIGYILQIGQPRLREGKSLNIQLVRDGSWLTPHLCVYRACWVFLIALKWSLKLEEHVVIKPSTFSLFLSTLT